MCSKCKRKSVNVCTYPMDPLATPALCAANEVGMDSNPVPGILSPASTATHPRTANILRRPCFNSASLIHSRVVIGVLSTASSQLSGTICWLQSFCDFYFFYDVLVRMNDVVTCFTIGIKRELWNESHGWKRTSAHISVKPMGSKPASPGRVPAGKWWSA